ncbi:hypothetical protein BS78_09G042300 [Paspalum vaginatum]|nr:hypothetical protein BS78_09G042300 [Paspalum vaginatum]
MGKDSRMEDGVGGEVLKLQPECLQHQHEERRDWDPQPTVEVGDEEDELPQLQVAVGGEPVRTLSRRSASVQPSRRRTRVRFSSVSRGDWWLGPIAEEAGDGKGKEHAAGKERELCCEEDEAPRRKRGVQRQMAEGRARPMAENPI